MTDFRTGNAADPAAIDQPEQNTILDNGLRIDSAHTTGSPPADAAKEQTALEKSAAAVLALGQLRNHAGQLAAHLHHIRQDLDRREDGLNNREADLENRLRAARLWSQEHDHELSQREELLVANQEELHRHKAELEAETSVNHANLAGAKQRLKEREKELAQRDAELETQTIRLQEQAATHKRIVEQFVREHKQLLKEVQDEKQKLEAQRRESADCVRRMRQDIEKHRESVVRECEALRQQWRAECVAELNGKTAELDERQRYLDDAEKLLVDGQKGLEISRQCLEADRLKFDNRMEAARQRQIENERRTKDKWQQAVLVLKRHTEQVDRRQKDIENLHTEVARRHRESLELRLATEELWRRLASRFPPAILAKSFGEIRRRLDDEYRHSRTQATETRTQLEKLRQRLVKKCEMLRAEKRDLDKRAQRRLNEIEQQSARLDTREQELDNQESLCRQLTGRWETDRQTYQAEIRRLLAKLRKSRPATITPP